MADYQRVLTVQDTVNRVLARLGLPLATSVFDSADGNVKQLISIANDVGQELLTESQWQFLNRDHQITTVPGQTEYPLPTDFDRYVSDAQWNLSTRLPMLGSIGDAQWAELKARQLGGLTIALLFRVDQGKLVLYASPSEAQVISLPYVGRGWVSAVDGSFQDSVESNDDLILYDSRLFRAKLLLEWQTSKGFDTTAAERRYLSLLGAAKNGDSPAQTLSIVPGGAVPLLGPLNIPETGYGSST